MTYRFLTMLALAFAALGLSALASAQSGPSSVFVETVKERDFAVRVEALGTLEPNEVVDLTLNTADRVQSLYFDDGQRVRKGKTLLSLAQREQIALTEEAEANVDEARRQLERVERLTERNAVSQAELDESRRAMNSASARLRAVQSRQKDRVLVAPFDGILGFRQVSVGTFIRPGDTVARLIDDSEMNLEFTVPSIFLRSLKPGTQITSRTDDLPDMVFNGVIATIDNAIDPVTRSISVRATIPNPDRILMSGMFMEIVLIADPRRSLSIPEEAIQPVGPRTFVFKVVDTTTPPSVQRVEVKLGPMQGGYVEVLSGLEIRDRVVTEGVIRIRDGSEIKIEDKSILSPTKSGELRLSEKTRAGTEMSDALQSP
ncbi:MexH family multidrug efflux RND transporter periplasmic adaptor subunit [Litorimonas cladophorae]|uniref:MexH family multidrug efflux RND transporter periplasmic adaptor subunit n=1 Tax=Litorimonas cladophorae TaxID=1220491 RepID=A0A918KU05_9PROT|nr:efflux RND transporter periplasmic adaptor subunit [Litorimonas cladophorae]GGX75991.1 MexH family multidrug efflux RND transporter periplasmic adaptor subunit [Litorimonas cladophorae]